MDPDRDFQHDFFFQMAAEAILLLDAEGIVERLNPAAAALLGLGPNAVGRAVSDVLHGVPTLVALCQGQGLQQGRVLLPRRRMADGVSQVRPGGGRIVILHDVTERSDIESRRAVLVRQVAHDLRNPLNAISGYADLIGRFGDLNADQRRFLERVCQTADKLYSLAETLVDLAWIEAGMALEHKPVALPEVIRQAVAQLEEQAAARQIALILSLQEPLPPLIGDPRRLGQAVSALLGNAIQYSPPESSVAVHLWQNGQRLYCSVGDQGIGIESDDLPRIWDRLWRSADERVRAVPGGGIGLTVARAVIARHGGRLWAESTPGQGTKVTFVLPLAKGW